MQPIPFEIKPGLQVVHLPTIVGSATAQLGSFWFKAALIVDEDVLLVVELVLVPNPEGVLLFAPKPELVDAPNALLFVPKPDDPPNAESLPPKPPNPPKSPNPPKPPKLSEAPPLEAVVTVVTTVVVVIAEALCARI